MVFKKLFENNFKKIIVGAVAIIAIFFLYKGMKPKIMTLGVPKLHSDEYVVLSKGKNINKIEAKGEVIGEDATNVYAEVSLPIQETKVDVGDEVHAGDVLAILDTTVLQDEIKQLEESIASTDSMNQLQLENSKAVYDNALLMSDENNNSDIKNSQTAVDSAKINLDDKKRDYENTKQLFDSGAATKNDLDNAYSVYEKASLEYDNACVALDNIKESVNLNLTTAKKGYELAKAKCEDQSQKIQLQNKKKNFDRSIIKAPIDGIIVSKNASVGNESKGELFEIKSSNDDTIKVNVKEVDIEKINLNQDVEIKTDSTGDQIIEGKVTYISPIAKKDNDSLLNLKDDSNDENAEFEVKIQVVNPEYKLKLGMKTTVEIITEEKDDDFIVPSECVVKNKDDKDVVYFLNKDENKYIINEIEVSKGTNNDLNVEIMANELQNDMIILKDPLKYEIGSIFKVEE